MKRLALVAMLLCASPCFGQLVLPSGTGVVQAPVDANGWLSYKLILTQNVTSFSFVVIPNGTPPPSQAIRTVEFVEDNVGGRTVTFASSILNPCTVSTGSNVVTVCQFIFDSSNNQWIGISGGGGASSIGAAINVKTLGAIGNGKFFSDGASSSNQVSSATATFSASDVGQTVNCIGNPLSGSAVVRINNTITSFVNSSTLTYGGASAGTQSSMYCTLTNPADPPAILAAFNNCKSATIPSGQGAVPTQAPSCNIYLPAGIYGLSNTLDNLIVTGNEQCVGIIGDGMRRSVIIPTITFTSTNRNNGGYIINARCTNEYYKDFSIELASVPVSPGNTAGFITINGSPGFMENVGVYDGCVTAGGMYGIDFQSGTNQVLIRPEVVSAAGCGGTNGGLQLISATNVMIYSPFLSNTAQNLQISNAVSGSNGAGITFYGGVIDEGSITSITNSIDVWFNGTTLTGGANCLSVDATSFVWLTGGYCGTFGAGTGGGPTVASGGVLNMTQVHVNAVNGGSACYTSAAYGGIVDDGTNRCTTSGGGTVYPSGGVINKTSLSHAQANAFQTGTLAATTNLMSFAVDQPIAIQTLSWTPNNAFACTAGAFPTLSVSDGTVTATTSVNDTSTNGTVTHTFPNTTASVLNPAGTVGTVITIKVVTTGTCGTAPTNTQVNVWWQATAPGV